MSYPSEAQWTPIICPICDSNIWVMGDRTRPHKCDPDDDSLERFVSNQLAPFSLQDMVKNIMRIE